MNRSCRLFLCGLLPVPLPTGGRAALPEAPSAADIEKQVKALVRQLGGDDFRQRQDAHRALINLGPDVVPILDKLGPPADAEVRRHLQQIRQDLVGFQEDIRAGLEALPEITDEVKPDIPDGLEADIVGRPDDQGLRPLRAAGPAQPAVSESPRWEKERREGEGSGPRERAPVPRTGHPVSVSGRRRRVAC